MMTFVPYRPWHAFAVDLQPLQAASRDKLLDPGYAASLAVPGLSWTAMDDDTVLGCAGLVPQWEGRAEAWALIGDIPRREWIRVVAKARAEIAKAGFRRIDAYVLRGFGEGCRFAKALRFNVNTILEKYGPDGQDYYLFERVA